jgi:thiol-disulfide isomerase/thioredoxin
LLASQEALFPDLYVVRERKERREAAPPHPYSRRYGTLLKTLAPLMEPQVEDFLRLRREAYGRVGGGQTLIPPPLPPQEVAELSSISNSKDVWAASLALNAQRLGAAGGGRGCSLVPAAASPDWNSPDWSGKEEKREDAAGILHMGSMEELLGNVGGARLCAVWFTATWCAPCKESEPEMAKVAEEGSGGRWLVVKVDVEELEDVADRFKITSVPCVWIMLDGKRVGVVLGGGEGAAGEVRRELEERA